MNLRANVKPATTPQNIENYALDAASSEKNGDAQNVKYKPKHTATINLI